MDNIIDPEKYINYFTLNCSLCNLNTLNAVVGIENTGEVYLCGAPHKDGVCYACLNNLSSDANVCAQVKKLIGENVVVYIWITIHTDNPVGALASAFNWFNQLKLTGLSGLKTAEVKKCRQCSANILKDGASLCPRCIRIIDVLKEGTFISAALTSSEPVNSFASEMIHSFAATKFVYFNAHCACGIIPKGLVAHSHCN